MPIRSLDHAQLAMPAGGEEAARKFYGRLLGIPEVPKPAPLAKRGGCWFERGAIRIHLGVDPEFRPARKAHLAFVVEDLAALCRVLDDAGHPARTGEPQDGLHRVYVDDPFGNRLELIALDSSNR